jgi:quercetin dioxygenase-like cupin family protein
MKKMIFSSLVLSITFAITAKAQHPMADDVNKTPPAIIFKKLLNTPEIKNQEIKIVLVTFAPGEVAGSHRHPIETIAYVLDGEIESTFDGKVQRFKKGEVFYERPNGLHAETKNLSKTKEAKLLVYFIGDPDKPFLIPEKNKPRI